MPASARPPLGRGNDENEPPLHPNGRCCSEEKLGTRPLSGRAHTPIGMRSVTGPGSAVRNTGAQILGCSMPRSTHHSPRNSFGNASGGLDAHCTFGVDAERLRTPPCSTPLTGQRAYSESPGPTTRTLTPHTGGLLESMRGSAGICLAALASAAKSPLRTVSPDALPEVWITKWVDYSSRYGVIYQLPDGSIGVYYNDSTKALCQQDGSNFDYIARGTPEQPAVRSTHTFEDYPAELQKKVTLLRHFRNTMATDLLGKRDGASSGESSLPQSYGARHGAPSQVYLRKWTRRGSALMFSLSNKDIQVVFFDKTEIVLSFRNHTVTYCDKHGTSKTLLLADALQNPCYDLSRRLRYILTNLLGVAASDLPASLRA